MLALSTLNTLALDPFTMALGFVFEGPPWIVAATWPARPFASLAALHSALVATMRNAPRERQLALIRAHPDLAGKAALAGELTPESTGEQAAAGLSHLTPAEYAEFTRLNTAYRARFGFPFVICAREQTKQSILAAFATRIQHEAEQEVATALDEIANIAWLRIAAGIES